MALSTDILSQLAKLINNNSNSKTAAASKLIGKIVDQDDTKWVRLEGSECLTPVETTTEVQDGDAVTVEISNHTAFVTGNLTTPSASKSTTDKIKHDVNTVATKVSDFEIIVAYKITADDITATNGYFDKIQSTVGTFKNLTTEELTAINASIESLKTKYIEGEKITVDNIEAINGEIENLKVTFETVGHLSAEEINAVKADIDQLTTYNANFTYVHSEVLSALKANINKLNVEKLEANWANIDYANIDEATFRKFFAESGIIQDITASDVTATGKLIGVLISGDMIEGNTIKADKLLLKGEGGLYYQININAEGVAEGEEVSTEGIDGRAIVAESITADKMKVTDLIAFAALIGGFEIGTNSIHSVTKDEVNNTTRGIYMDNDGQINIGDSSQYIRFAKDVKQYEVAPIIDGDFITGEFSFSHWESTDYPIQYDTSIWEIVETGELTDNGHDVMFAIEKTEYVGAGEYLDIVEDKIWEIPNVYTDDGSAIYAVITTHGQRRLCRLNDSKYEMLKKTDGNFAYPSVYYEVIKYALEIVADKITFTDREFDKLKELNTHVRIGSYTDPDTNDTDPCLELFEDESSDVQRQTNKRTAFIHDNKEVVSVGADGVMHHVHTDTHKGQYVWTTRANGNFGLMWKDVIE